MKTNLFAFLSDTNIIWKWLSLFFSGCGIFIIGVCFSKYMWHWDLESFVINILYLLTFSISFLYIGAWNMDEQTKNHYTFETTMEGIYNAIRNARERYENSINLWDCVDPKTINRYNAFTDKNEMYRKIIRRLQTADLYISVVPKTESTCNYKADVIISWREESD